MSDFMKIRPAGAELFHADRWTAMTKLTVAYRNFVSAPKKGRGIIPAKPGRNSMYCTTLQDVEISRVQTTQFI